MSDWPTKRDWEEEGARQLRVDETLTPIERKRVEHRVYQKKSNRMTPDKAETFRRFEQFWRTRSQDWAFVTGPPLPFEVTMDDPGGDVSLTEFTFTRAFLNKIRFYSGSIVSASRWMFFTGWLVKAFAIAFLGIFLIEFFATARWPSLSSFLGALFFGSAGYLMERYSQIVNRVANNIFERETGKVYLFRHRDPHAVYDFHKLYWTMQHVPSGAGSNTSLVAFDVDPETGEVRSSGEGDDEGEAVFSVTLPTTYEAHMFWQALVRYMDTDWPLEDNVPTEKLKEGPLPYEETIQGTFDRYNRERNKRGFKVEGVRFADGTAEWLLPGDDRLYIGPWYEKLKKFKRMGKQFRLKTAPPGIPDDNSSRPAANSSGIVDG